MNVSLFNYEATCKFSCFDYPFSNILPKELYESNTNFFIVTELLTCKIKRYIGPRRNRLLSPLSWKYQVLPPDPMCGPA
jgi:hypothetical protein